MTAAQAAGQRYIGVAHFAWLRDLARVLRERLGADAKKVPKRDAADALVKLLSVFDPSIRGFVGDLGMRTTYSHAKATAELGWNPRPLEDSIVDCARSLLSAGA